MSDTATVITATGRRKLATARVRLTPNGTGSFTVNGKDLEVYCYSEFLAHTAEGPLVTADRKGQFDVVAKVEGGGPHGQATAVAHGLARALVKFDSELRSVLKKAGHMKRDPRRRERKKSGQPGARKRFQFSKR